MLNIKFRISSHFQNFPSKVFNPKQLLSYLRMRSAKDKNLLIIALNELIADRVIKEVSPHHYQLNFIGDEYIGIFHGKANGHNYVILDEREDQNDGITEVKVDEKYSHHALDKDKVRVKLFPKKRKSDADQYGEVDEILERADQNYVGEVSIPKGSNLCFVIPDGNRLYNDIFIPPKYLHGAKDGDKVLVHIEQWKENDKNPQGQIIDILGKSGENNAEMHAILAEFGLPYKYPKEVEEAADKIPEELNKEQMAERVDFTDTLTFTIDPADAKDFDDALSYKQLKKGVHQVGVHIADVTAYVKPGDIIDKEARERATSVYLVDRTIPMLPEKLCNDLCSLKPDVKRAAYSVVFELNEQGVILNYKIHKSLIHSNRRLNYEEALAVIKHEESQGEELDAAIWQLNDLATKIRRSRFAAGAINFDRNEVKFVLDDAGKPIDVVKKESHEANWLIEEFMLLANRTVAEHIAKKREDSKKWPFIYRVHDLPADEKLKDLGEFLMGLKYKFKAQGSPQQVAAELNKLLETFNGKPEQNMLETIVIKTMAKAIYTTDNVGHYGLGFDYYTHFTSPIRRYPDVLVHRLLWAYEHNEKLMNKNELEGLAKHCSSQEQLASNAERASIKYKQVEFMQDKVGQEFDGVVSSVTSFGIFVELKENGCEGLIPMHQMDDYYVFDEKNYRIVGKRTHKIFKLGDDIRVLVDRADLDKKQLDFSLVTTK